MLNPLTLVLPSLLLSLSIDAAPSQREIGIERLQEMSGCFDTTYEFKELETQPGMPRAYRETTSVAERHWIELVELPEDGAFELHFWMNTTRSPEPFFHYGERWSFVPANEEGALPSAWKQQVFIEIPAGRRWGWTCEAEWRDSVRVCTNIESWKPQRHTRLRKLGPRNYESFIRNHILIVRPNSHSMTENNLILNETFTLIGNHGEINEVQVSERADLGFAGFQRVLDRMNRPIDSKEGCFPASP